MRGVNTVHITETRSVIVTFSPLPVERERLHQRGHEPLVKDEGPFLLEHLRRGVRNPFVRVGGAAASLQKEAEQEGVRGPELGRRGSRFIDKVDQVSMQAREDKNRRFCISLVPHLWFSVKQPCLRPTSLPMPPFHRPPPPHLNAALDYVHGVDGQPGNLAAEAPCGQVLPIRVPPVLAARRPRPLDRLVGNVVARHPRHVAGLVVSS